MSGESLKTGTEQEVSPGEGYGGEVSPEDAWEILKETPDAVLVDCRTQPEWAFVGVPDLGSLSKETLFIPWQVFPAMRVNSEFVNQVKAGGGGEDTPVLVMCRSGARSQSPAAQAARVAKRARTGAPLPEGGRDEI